jgi:SAM-dependent methyltransferase
MNWARDLDDQAWAQALAGGDSRAPPMPSEAVQSMFVGSSGVSAFKEAAAFWGLTQRAMRDVQLPLSHNTRIIDIGVGWGRVYRWALRDVSIDKIVGIDVDPKAIEICMNAMPGGRFQHVPPDSLYPIDNGLYDLGISYSVFSHLSEGTANSVLATAKKALKPGGLLALTTFRPAHIDVWDRQNSSLPRPDVLVKCGFDRIEWWQKATEGAHLYVPTGGGDPTRPADAYGEAVVPKGWWEKVEGYRLVTFERPSELPQAFVVLQRC